MTQTAQSTETQPTVTEEILTITQRQRVLLAQKARGILTNTTLISSSGPSAEEIVRLASWMEGPSSSYESDAPPWLADEDRDVLLEAIDKVDTDDQDDLKGSPEDDMQYAAHECAPGVLPKGLEELERILDIQIVRRSHGLHEHGLHEQALHEGFGGVHDRYPGRTA